MTTYQYTSDKYGNAEVTGTFDEIKAAINDAYPEAKLREIVSFKNRIVDQDNDVIAVEI